MVLCLLGPPFYGGLADALRRSSASFTRLIAIVASAMAKAANHESLVNEAENETPRGSFDPP
jgi:hypothetical protein